MESGDTHRVLGGGGHRRGPTGVERRHTPGSGCHRGVAHQYQLTAPLSTLCGAGVAVRRGTGGRGLRPRHRRFFPQSVLEKRRGAGCTQALPGGAESLQGRVCTLTSILQGTGCVCEPCSTHENRGEQSSMKLTSHPIRPEGGIAHTTLSSHPTTTTLQVETRAGEPRVREEAVVEHRAVHARADRRAHPGADRGAAGRGHHRRARARDGGTRGDGGGAVQNDLRGACEAG